MTRPDPSPVSRRDLGSVAILSMQRPDQHNALSSTLIEALDSAFDRIAVEPAVRSVVLAASGPVFCSGLDFRQAPDSSGSSVAEAQALADLLDRVHKFPRPVVSAVSGDAVAAGASLALAADLVVMADSARIGFPEVTLGLVPALALHDLARQVGERLARELLLSGRLVDSDEALRRGLVNRVVAVEHVLDESIRLASEFENAAPVALASIKHLLDESLQRPRTLRGAAAVSAAVRDSDEAREGLDALLQNRPPRWTSLPETPPST